MLKIVVTPLFLPLRLSSPKWVEFLLIAHVVVFVVVAYTDGRAWWRLPLMWTALHA